LKSKVDEGSEFILKIPVSKQSEPSQLETEQNIVKVIKEDVEQIHNILVEENPVLEIPEDVDDDRGTITDEDKVILIIEDDTNFAKALLKYARMQDYKGVVVVRGDHALSAAIQYHPSAILLIFSCL
jgi:hypothetical protein